MLADIEKVDCIHCRREILLLISLSSSKFLVVVTIIAFITTSLYSPYILQMHSIFRYTLRRYFVVSETVSAQLRHQYIHIFFSLHM